MKENMAKKQTKEFMSGYKIGFKDCQIELIKVIKKEHIKGNFDLITPAYYLMDKIYEVNPQDGLGWNPNWRIKKGKLKIKKKGVKNG